MKKRTVIFLFLFSLAIINQAGNSLSAPIAESTSLAAGDAEATDINEPAPYSPREVGMSPSILARIGTIAKGGIKAKAYPGCQILVMKDGKTIYDKSFGHFTYERKQNVKQTTMYDLASLSKTTGTLLAIMKLYDEGKIQLTDKISLYLPFLQGTDKENITITELLFHESGLPASLSCSYLAVTKDTSHSIHIGCINYIDTLVSRTPAADYPLQVSDSFYLHKSFHDSAMHKIANARLRSKTYLYSCVNFILLKEIAEAISGTPMDVFLDSSFYKPMELKNTAYLPLRTHPKEQIAPTLKNDGLRNGLIQGYVHDPDAALLGGVSGNAGLFASARDVAKVYQMLLNHGELDGKRYLSAETCRIFTTTTSASGRRGLGFDKPVASNPLHSPCCASAPPEVFGHTGYTGTCCWADPVNNLVYVFLSNRTYPNDGVNKLARLGIRTSIQEVIYQSIKQK